MFYSEKENCMKEPEVKMFIKYCLIGVVLEEKDLQKIVNTEDKRDNPQTVMLLNF